MKELLQEMIFITIALYAIGKSDVSVKAVSYTHLTLPTT